MRQTAPLTLLALLDNPAGSTVELSFTIYTEPGYGQSVHGLSTNPPTLRTSTAYMRDNLVSNINGADDVTELPDGRYTATWSPVSGFDFEFEAPATAKPAENESIETAPDEIEPDTGTDVQADSAEDETVETATAEPNPKAVMRVALAELRNLHSYLELIAREVSTTVIQDELHQSCQAYCLAQAFTGMIGVPSAPDGTHLDIKNLQVVGVTDFQKSDSLAGLSAILDGQNPILSGAGLNERELDEIERSARNQTDRIPRDQPTLAIMVPFAGPFTLWLRSSIQTVADGILTDNREAWTKGWIENTLERLKSFADDTGNDAVFETNTPSDEVAAVEDDDSEDVDGTTPDVDPIEDEPIVAASEEDDVNRVEYDDSDGIEEPNGTDDVGPAILTDEVESVEIEDGTTQVRTSEVDDGNAQVQVSGKPPTGSDFAPAPAG